MDYTSLCCSVNLPNNFLQADASINYMIVQHCCLLSMREIANQAYGAQTFLPSQWMDFAFGTLDGPKVFLTCKSIHIDYAKIAKKLF